MGVGGGEVQNAIDRICSSRIRALAVACAMSGRTYWQLYTFDLVSARWCGVNPEQPYYCTPYMYCIYGLITINQLVPPNGSIALYGVERCLSLQAHAWLVLMSQPPHYSLHIISAYRTP